MPYPRHPVRPRAHTQSKRQWNRGESNPAAVLARHRSRPRAIPFVQWIPRGVAPRFPACEAGVFLLDDGPMLLSAPRKGAGVTRVGVEPTLDRLSTCRLYQLAYLVIQLRSPGIEPGRQAYETRPNTSPPAMIWHSDQGGSRTHNRQVLNLPALPVGNTWPSVADPGLEPGCQAYETRPDPVCLQSISAPCLRSAASAASLQGVVVVTVGFEPTLSTF